MVQTFKQRLCKQRVWCTACVFGNGCCWNGLFRSCRQRLFGSDIPQFSLLNDHPEKHSEDQQHQHIENIVAFSTGFHKMSRSSTNIIFFSKLPTSSIAFYPALAHILFHYHLLPRIAKRSKRTLSISLSLNQITSQTAL